MSSENKRGKPDSQQPEPKSGPAPRLSSRAPSATGKVRDALAALHNLEALLRSASVRYDTILDVLPELRTGASVLREPFERTRGEPSPAAVGDYGLSQVAELEGLLEATAQADEERKDLAARAAGLAARLEAAADLAALLARAAAPVPAETSPHQLLLQTGRFPGGRGREVAVRFDCPAPDATVEADPYLLGQLLSLTLAHVLDASVEIVARCSPAERTLALEPVGPADAGLPSLTMRAPLLVPPTQDTARRVAASLGVTLELERGRGVVRFPAAPG